MTLFIRPTRPIARPAAGAVSSGDEEMHRAYEASFMAPMPQYTPLPFQEEQAAGDIDTLTRFNATGILTDAEFESAKAKLLRL